MNPDRSVVLITGGSSGIGRACAEHLAARGYRVYAASRHPRPEMALPNLVPLAMDVTQDTSVAEAFQTVLAREGRLDVVVNGAGIGYAGSVEDTSLAEAHESFETNYFGALRVCRAALPIMRRQKQGLIVTISSIGGTVGLAYQAQYSASKYALEGLSEALRQEVRPWGIQVVLIRPTDMATGFTDARRRTGQSATNPAYRAILERYMKGMEEGERQGVSPLLAAHCLERIIRTPRPRLRYEVGSFLQRIVPVAKRFLPDGVLEWVMMLFYGLPRTLTDDMAQEERGGNRAG